MNVHRPRSLPRPMTLASYSCLPKLLLDGSAAGISYSRPLLSADGSTVVKCYFSKIAECDITHASLQHLLRHLFGAFDTVPTQPRHVTAHSTQHRSSSGVKLKLSIPGT